MQLGLLALRTLLSKKSKLFLNSPHEVVFDILSMRGFAPARRGTFVSAKVPQTISSARARPYGSLRLHPESRWLRNSLRSNSLRREADSGRRLRRARRRGITLETNQLLAEGGKSTNGNIVPFCMECNRKKKLEMPAEAARRKLSGEKFHLFFESATNAGFFALAQNSQTPFSFKTPPTFSHSSGGKWRIHPSSGWT